MKKMVPNSNGYATTLQSGVQETYNFSYNFQGQYTLPADANYPLII